MRNTISTREVFTCTTKKLMIALKKTYTKIGLSLLNQAKPDTYLLGYGFAFFV